MTKLSFYQTRSFWICLATTIEGAITGIAVSGIAHKLMDVPHGNGQWIAWSAGVGAITGLLIGLALSEKYG